jgi:hypothetical protein
MLRFRVLHKIGSFCWTECPCRDITWEVLVSSIMVVGGDSNAR